MSNSPYGGSSRQHHEPALCGICGGDGRIDNSFGNVARCPSCGGSGRRREEIAFHDVTKTKEAHHQRSNRAPAVEKQTWPSTHAGAQLATEIRDAASLTAEVKARLTREIIDHEASHGLCTQTFIKKMRKQFRPQPPR
ncbi:MAG: molecular chaperone DnaJ [Myxococcales bacterium]|nr:molecular chaperone DnaJ [Myxococcales bacterium]